MSEAAQVLAGVPAPTTGTQAATGQAEAPVATVTTNDAIPEWAKDWKPETQSLLGKKKWTSPEQVAEGYGNLERLLSGDKIPLPKDEKDPAWADVWKKLGALDKPEEYAAFVKPVEGTPDLDPGFIGAMSTLAQKANLTPAQWATMVEGYQELSKAALAENGESEATMAARIETDMAALKSELGPKYDAYLADAQRAGIAAKMTPEESALMMQAFGVKRAMEIMNANGSKFGKEAEWKEGNGGPQGIMTPEMARVKIAELGKDADFLRRYTSGDVKAQAEMTGLHKIAAGEA